MDIALNRILHIGFPDMDDASMHDITTNIEAGSASISEILVSSENIRFGEYNSNKFEVMIYGISDVSNEKIVVWTSTVNSTAVVGDAISGNAIVSNGSNVQTRTLFTGYVDSCKLDNFGYYRHIIAYDIFATIRNVSVADWWNNFWTEDLTRVDGVPLYFLRKSLIEYMGFQHLPSVLFNDSLIVKPVVMTIGTLRFADLLQMICELQCLFPYITRSGNLSFINILVSSTKNIQSEYEHVNSNFEDYTTHTVTKLVIEQNGDILRSVTTPTPAIAHIAIAGKSIVGLTNIEHVTETEESNVYTIEDNLLLQSFNRYELGSFAIKYLSHIRDTPIYTPASIKMIVSDFSLSLGDKLVTDRGTTLVLRNELSGSLLVEQSLSATGEQFYPEVIDENTSEQVYISTGLSNVTDLANRKSTVFYDSTEPEGDDFVVNDTWFKEEADGSITTYIWDGYQWVQEQFGNEAIKNLSITNAKIADATIQGAKIANLDAGKITSGTLTGRRINNGNGTFLVTESGALTATSANITGTINSTSGTIGGWSIGSAALKATSGGLTTGLQVPSSGTYAIAVGSTSSSSWSSAPFRVTHAGAVYCSNLTVSGGSITLGNTSISSSGYLSSTNANITNSSFGGSFGGTGSFGSGSSLVGSFSGVGTLSSGSSLTSYNSGQIIYLSVGGYTSWMSAAGMQVSGDGSTCQYFSTGQNVVSDRRVKQNIVSLDKIETANFIYSLNPVRYALKGDSNKKHHHGFIAQEVDKIIPDSKWSIVSTMETDETEYLSINYMELISDLVATVQSLNDRIKILEDK